MFLEREASHSQFASCCLRCRGESSIASLGSLPCTTQQWCTHRGPMAKRGAQDTRVVQRELSLLVLRAAVHTRPPMALLEVHWHQITILLKYYRQGTIYLRKKCPSEAPTDIASVLWSLHLNQIVTFVLNTPSSPIWKLFFHKPDLYKKIKNKK